MRTCQPLLTPPPLYVYTYILTKPTGLFLDCQIRFSNLYLKIY